VAHAQPTHREALEALGIRSGLFAPFEAYLDLMALWSPRINLTGARTPQARVDVLIADACRAAPKVEGPRLVDVGSGNGSPGLVLSMLRPDVAVTLLEPRTKRWAFLQEACRRVGRPDIRVVRARHTEYRGEPASTLSLRGLRLPLLELSSLVVEGGRLLLFGKAPNRTGPFALETTHSLTHGQLHVFRRIVSRETIERGSTG